MRYAIGQGAEAPEGKRHLLAGAVYQLEDTPNGPNHHLVVKTRGGNLVVRPAGVQDLPGDAVPASQVDVASCAERNGQVAEFVGFA